MARREFLSTGGFPHSELNTWEKLEILLLGAAGGEGLNGHLSSSERLRETKAKRRFHEDCDRETVREIVDMQGFLR